MYAIRSYYEVADPAVTGFPTSIWFSKIPSGEGGCIFAWAVSAAPEKTSAVRRLRVNIGGWDIGV